MNPTESTLASSHQLAAWLIELLDIKRAHVARGTKNNPANLSQWLQGRDKLLSPERQEAVLIWLGLKYGKLDAGRVHQWLVGNDYNALRGLLQATETRESLSGLHIHQVNKVDVPENQNPVLLMMDRPGPNPLLILVFRPESSGKHLLELSASNLGLGIDGKYIVLPKGSLGLHYSEPSPEDFLRTINLHNRLDSLPAGSVFLAATMNKKGLPPDQLLAEMEQTISMLRNDVSDLRVHEARLRAVIRNALNVIGQLSPNHPLLEAETRESFYEDY